jgi:SAM-dependent methyltransferase
MDVHDRWAAGSAYEAFMGRWSRELAARFVSWLRVARGAHWLDVGCGTGSLTNAIVRDADPASVVGCDPAEPFIAFARGQLPDARKTFVVAGVGALPRRPAGYDSVASLLALNFFPDPGAAVEEMRTVAAREATVSACVWDYAEGMGFLRHFWDAAAIMEGTAPALDERNRFPICRPDALTTLFSSRGLADVRCDAIEIPTRFTSFSDLWQPFLGGTGPAPFYVASLDAERRMILARALDQRLPRGPDGTIDLIARAWAVRGKVET